MKSMLITNHFFPYLFSLFFFWVISKETVGNSWTVLKVILGHKYHHNHSVRSISTDYSQNPQQKVSFIVYCCLRLLYRKRRHDAQITWPTTSLWGADAKWLNRAPKTKLILCPRDPQEYSLYQFEPARQHFERVPVFHGVCEISLNEVLATQMGVMRRSKKVSSFELFELYKLNPLSPHCGSIARGLVHCYTWGRLRIVTVRGNTVGRHS